jgi:hypothetical protein
MRAPDHDAAGDAGAAAAGDAGAAGDADGQGAGDQGAAAADGAVADSSVDLASATAGDGAGDAGGDDAAAGKDGGDDQGADAGPPEAYELKLTTQNDKGEETAVELDPVLVETATPLLKEVGLSNEAANKLMPLIPKIHERFLAQQADRFEETKADWAKAMQADPEIGGKNLKETKNLAARALDHFAGGAEKNEDGTYKSGFRQLLEDTGLTSHPDMARLLRQVGAGLSEDGAFPRPESKTVVLPREELLYPDDVPKKK